MTTRPAIERVIQTLCAPAHAREVDTARDFLRMFAGLLRSSDSASLPSTRQLRHLAECLSDGQRAWLSLCADVVNRVDDLTFAARVGYARYALEGAARRGAYNGESMYVPSWTFMARTGWTAAHAVEIFEALARRASSPYTQMDTPAAPNFISISPVWTFDRAGQSVTRLADGNLLYCGGSHAWLGDPHYYIYNDVVIIASDLEVEIRGYPEEVFAPRDFHSATQVGNTLYVIGGVGDSEKMAPTPQQTPVYALDLATFRMSTVTTHGESPGMVFGHTSTYMYAHNIIEVSGGSRLIRKGIQPQHLDCGERYSLDLTTKRWTRRPSES